MDFQLEDVSGIGKATAKRLREVGIDTVEKLANVKIEDLLKLQIKGIGEVTGKKYIQSAQELFEQISENEVSISEEGKSTVSEVIEPKKEKKRKPGSKVSELKNLIKQQAECNIGLVGHVDHGMMMSCRHFP
jgi:nucleotidyltransferase/DNA polymerase involved in DNA repair